MVSQENWHWATDNNFKEIGKKGSPGCGSEKRSSNGAQQCLWVEKNEVKLLCRFNYPFVKKNNPI